MTDHLSALAPPPDDEFDRMHDNAAIGRMLIQRLTYVIVGAWADGDYPDARSDLRDVMTQLYRDAAEARARREDLEASGCERAGERLNAEWARATSALMCSDTGHPSWDGIADRLWDDVPAAPIQDDEW